MLCALGCCLAEICAYPDGDERKKRRNFERCYPGRKRHSFYNSKYECCSVIITDPAPHHYTPSTPSICLDQALIVIEFDVPTLHPQPTISKRIRRRIAHHTNVEISNVDTFQPNVGAHLEVQYKVREHAASRA